MKSNRGNSFTAIRFILATAVLFSHSFPLSGRAEFSPRGLNIGVLAVDSFFALSGYLISKSWFREPKALAFFMARLLRVGPALFVALLFSSFVAKQSDLFGTNPVPWIANGSVWTLSWEIACYIMVLLLGVVGVWNSGNLPILYVFVFLLFIFNRGLDPSMSTRIVAPLIILFLGGALVSALEERVHWRVLGPLSFIGCLSILSPIKDNYLKLFRSVPQTWGPTVSDELFISSLYLMFLPFFVVWVGSKIPLKFEVRHDYSYGIYLYAWPCQQFIENSFEDLSVTIFFGVSFLASFTLSIISWHFIEKPISNQKTRIVNFLQFCAHRISKLIWPLKDEG